MKHVSRLCLLIGLSISSISFAAPPFTPEQYQEIGRLLAAERVRVRAEVRQEIIAELARAKSPDSIAAIGEPLPQASPDSEDVDEGLGAGEDVTPPPLMGDIGITTVDQDFSKAGSGVEFSAIAGDSDAAITLARSVSGVLNERHFDNTWRFSLSAPIDDTDHKRANFGTLSGFANGLSVKAAWTHASTRQVIMGGKTPSDEWKNLCTLSHQDVKDCILADIDAAASDAGAGELRTAYAAFQKHQYHWGRLYDLHVGASRKQYRFLDALLAKQSDVRFGWTAGGALGFSTPSRKALYSVGFDLERTSEEQDESVYCPGLSPVPCVTGRLGAPHKDWNRLLWAEARSSAFRVPFGFRVTRELEDHITGIDLPIYFLHGDDGVFTGGLRLGWTTEDGFDAGIFVGTGFDVFN